MSLLSRVVAAFEHFEPTPYLDPVGLPSIAFGHLIKPGETFNAPMSRGAAYLLLEKDLGEARRAVDRLFRGVFLSEYEFDALTSFTFNLGQMHVADSTLRNKVLNGDKIAASHEFCRWIYGTRKTQDGHVKVKLPGLIKRRDVESVWFLGAHPETVARLAGADPADD